MFIGLTLKADVAVSLHAVAVSEAKQKPLHHIPQEEGQIEHLALLVAVYVFMPEFAGRKRTAGQDKPEQVDGEETPSCRMSPDGKDMLHTAAWM